MVKRTYFTPNVDFFSVIIQSRVPSDKLRFDDELFKQVLRAERGRFVFRLKRWSLNVSLSDNAMRVVSFRRTEENPEKSREFYGGRRFFLNLW